MMELALTVPTGLARFAPTGWDTCPALLASFASLDLEVLSKCCLYEIMSQRIHYCRVIILQNVSSFPFPPESVLHSKSQINSFYGCTISFTTKMSAYLIYMKFIPNPFVMIRKLLQLGVPGRRLGGVGTQSLCNMYSLWKITLNDYHQVIEMSLKTGLLPVLLSVQLST